MLNYQDIMSSVWCMTLYVCSKTYNDFLCQRPQSEESFLNKKHPYNSAEPSAREYEPHNTSVSIPSEYDAQSTKLLHMLRRIIGSYGRGG